MTFLEGIVWLLVIIMATIIGLVAHATLSPIASVGLAVMVLAIAFAYMA